MEPHFIQRGNDLSYVGATAVRKGNKGVVYYFSGKEGHHISIIRRYVGMACVIAADALEPVSSAVKDRNSCYIVLFSHGHNFAEGFQYIIGIGKDHRIFFV